MMESVSALAIETRNLTKYFGKKAVVNELNLSVPRGCACGFLGPNGAGKTSTLRMLLGLSRPYLGTIALLGLESPGQIREINRRVGSLVERPSFYEDLTGLQNLTLLGNIGARVSEARIAEVIEMVGLDEARDKYFGAYSTGMAQRLGIAFAILNKPEMILLDEPTSGLDPKGRADVRDIIKKLITETGLTVFLSTHLLHEVEETCDHVCIIDEGRLVVQGSVRDLLSREVEPYSLVLAEKEDLTSFFSALPFVEHVEYSPAKYRLRLKKGDSGQLARAIFEKGLTLEALIPEEKSLEQFFLKVTGGHTQ